MNVLICSSCGQAACAAGDLLCKDYQRASIVRIIEVDDPYDGPVPQ